MRLALARHDALMRTAIEGHDGHVFKTIGDAFCAAFRTAHNALAAALTAQLALTSEAWPDGVTIKVRMALHTGVTEERDRDYFGQPLNRVARLLSTGYGGQVLLSLLTEKLARDLLPAAVSLRALGEHRLRDLNRPETIFQLLHPDLPAEFPPLKSLDNRDLPNNLPLQLTSFIGRDKEMAQVKVLLTKTRLLTLTGSGGCGKTRLALQVAAEVLDQYPDGVWLVELAPLADPALAPQTVAAALGLTEQTGKTLMQTLTEYLKSKRLLLVLDNCEHLLSACAQLGDALLRACSHLTILASSREGLGMAGEQTYRVPSLSLPDLRQPLNVEQVSQYEAVRLFIERAVNSKADFLVTHQNTHALVSVCHRLDGIPLAIELAAARVRSLSVEEIDTRLDHSFRILTGGSKTTLPRQQTLRALIDWSYNLLNGSEKALLARLSAFAGGWTLQAAEQVGAGESDTGEGIEEWEVVNLLTSLVDKSLVLAETHVETTRYRLLETVRQYARDRLAEGEEGIGVRRRHRDFFLVLVEETRPKLHGAEQEQWLAVLEEEYDNLRQALNFCLEEPEEGAAGLRLGAALQGFWWTRGHLSEGRQYLSAVLTRSVGQGHLKARADALNGAGNLAWMQSDYVVARALFEESLTIRRELEDKQGIASSLNNLGNVTQYQGDYAAARALHEESLTIRRELGDTQGVAASLNNLGQVAIYRGDYAAARALHGESLTIRRELGDKQGIAGSLNNLGQVANNQGDYAAARALFEEALRLNRELGNRAWEAINCNNLGNVAHYQGDYGAARALFEESLTIRRELGDRGGIASCLRNLGTIIYDQGDYGAALALFEESLTICRELGDRRGIAESLLGLGKVVFYQGDAAAARALYEESLMLFQELGEKLGIAFALDAFADLTHQEQNEHRAVRLWAAETALREGIGAQRSPKNQERFDRQVAKARAALDKAAFAAAWEEGRAMTMEQAGEYALERASL
jgi:predicted ATPase